MPQTIVNALKSLTKLVEDAETAFEPGIIQQLNEIYIIVKKNENSLGKNTLASNPNGTFAAILTPAKLFKQALDSIKIKCSMLSLCLLLFLSKNSMKLIIQTYT